MRLLQLYLVGKVSKQVIRDISNRDNRDKPQVSTSIKQLDKTSIKFHQHLASHNYNWYLYLVFETHITRSTSASENSRNLLVITELGSAKPNKEWSVKTVFKPSVLACNKASWHRVENACNSKMKTINSILRVFHWKLINSCKHRKPIPKVQWYIQYFYLYWN